MSINIKYVLVIVLLFIIALSIRECQHQQDFSKFKKNVETASNNDTSHYKTKSGKDAVLAPVQQFSTKDLKNLDIPELAEARKQISDLQQKLNNVKYYSATATNSHNQYVARTKDSTVIHNDTQRVVLETFEADTRFRHISGWKYKDSCEAPYHITEDCKDTLHTSVSYYRKWFLGVRRAKVASAMADTTVHITQAIFIEVDRSHPWWEFWKKE